MDRTMIPGVHDGNGPGWQRGRERGSEGRLSRVRIHSFALAEKRREVL
ncbi:hypothetical protein J2741_000346 [Methanolinea mesophila]|nr:hypothetical protein [Methanolinea mesophila]MBP1927799.1 hypothetical protein [Methanolinea mesophila]